MAISMNRLEGEIDHTLELSTICRGEWCRALESQVNNLDAELTEVSRVKTIADSSRFAKMSEKVRKAYRNLGPNIHV